MRNNLGVAPYQSEEREFDADEEDDVRSGSIIMGISYSEDRWVSCCANDLKFKLHLVCA